MTDAGDLRPRKRSVTLRGHRTSVSLEDAFWTELLRLSAERGLSVNALVSEIDEARGLRSGLASAIRVYVLREAIAQRGSSES
ncbi:MAG: ribbon-helix-helix domain-containing protein [Pseudomonadota bacterium]